MESLARKPGLKVSRGTAFAALADKAKSLYDLMTEKAKAGGIDSIKDPVAWQKELREDKILYEREDQ